MDLLRFITAGSVDDGKSTLIGRLLYDSKSILADQLEALERQSRNKEDGEIDWNWPARKIFNRSRGFIPWPGAYSFFRGRMFHIWRSGVSSELSGEPGQMIPQKKRLLIVCSGATVLEAVEVQVEGKKRMSAEAFLNGHQVKDGEMLGVKVA